MRAKVSPSGLTPVPADLDQIISSATTCEQMNFAKLVDGADFDLTLAPTPSFVAARLARRKQGRAAGTDGVVGELHRECADSLRGPSYAMALKAAWTLAPPPLAMRGKHSGALEGQGVGLALQQLP